MVGVCLLDVQAAVVLIFTEVRAMLLGVGKWLCVALLLVPCSSNGQQPVTFACKFTAASDQDAKWGQKAKFPDSFAVRNTEFEMTFVATGKDAVTIYKEGKGTVPVKVLHTPFQGHLFVETTGNQNLIVTSIDKFGNAVSSRHLEMVDGWLMPAQLYGKCERR